MSHTSALVFLIGGVYALFASGAALKFRATARFDLAHAALLGVSAGTCMLVTARERSIADGLLAGTLAGALTGLIVDRLVLAPIRARGGALGGNGTLVAGAAIFALLLSWPGRLPTVVGGVNAGLHALLRPLIGRDGGDAALWIGGGLCLALMLLTASVVRWTRFGTGVRAVSENPEAARAAGIDVEWLRSQTAFIASALAAVAALLFAGLVPAPMAGLLSLPAGVLAACALGGVDSMLGVAAGGYVVAALQLWLETRVPAANWMLAVTVISCIVIFATPHGFTRNGALRPASAR